MKVGFIGLGRMGLPMAGRLVDAGHEVTGWDTDPSARERATDGSIALAQSSREIDGDTGAIILCLPGPAECAAAIDGPDGLLERAPAGSLVIDTSTVGQADALRWSDAFSAKGKTYIDAPITGGVAGAIAGKLTVFVGGEASDVDRARPLLEALGDRVEHVGPAGSGAALKLINQAIYLAHCVALAEATATADAAGIDPARLLDLLPASVAGNPLSTGWFQILGTDNREPGFAIARAAKDVALFREIAAAAGSEQPLLQALYDRLHQGIEDGIGDRDIAALADKN